MLRFGDTPKFGEHHRLSKAALPGDQHNAPRSPYSVGQRFGKILDDGVPTNKNLAAYQIMAEVFDRLDIHSGTVFNYHQQRRQTKNYQADLELLQYDLLYGKQYAYDKYGSPIKEGHMVMGVSDVTLDSVIEQLDGSYSLYGENFTKQSKVYVNGEKQTSTFLNNTRLDLKDVELKDGDVIQVNQVGSSETIFRESAQYEYKDEKLTKLPDAEDKVETGRNAFVNQDKDVKKESKDE